MRNERRHAGRSFGALRGGLALAALFVSFGTVLNAQTVTDPRTVSFIPSSDHDAAGPDGQPAVLLYELEFFQAGATTPFVVLNLGKPSPAADGRITVDFRTPLGGALLPGQQLFARVAAVGPGRRAESENSNPFIFVWPRPPDFDAPQLVKITSPPSGTTVKPGDSITFMSAVNTTVSGVDFYANGVYVGTAASSPYQLTWAPTVVGRYAITSVTVDRNGVQRISAPVFVNVSHVVGKSRTAPVSARFVGRAKQRPGK